MQRRAQLAALLLAGGIASWGADPAQAQARPDRPAGQTAPRAESIPSSRAAELLARAIRISTTNPPGNEAELAEMLVAELTEAGVEARIVLTPSQDGSRRAATWARVRGTGVARPIILLSHLDVVPADAGQWSVDPFAGIVENGFVLGRGALDAKGVAVTHLLTLLALAERSEPLERDVILLATPDEETGGEAGTGYLVRERRELLGDAEYVLTEGGSIRAPGPLGSSAIWGVAITEKIPCWISLRTRGSTGHSSAPGAEDAVPRLVAALDRVRRIESPVRVVPEVETMFGMLAPFADDNERWAFADLAHSLNDDPSFRRRFLGHPGRRALVRDTVSITVVQAGSRTNVIPSEATAQIDARLLPGSSCADFRSELVGVIADLGVEVSTLLSFSAGRSSPDTALFRAIERVAAKTDPGSLVIPRMLAGFTDAHWFRDIGITAYGFVPRWLTPEDSRGVHGVNERISIENLERGARTLTRILEELAGAGTEG